MENKEEKKEEKKAKYLSDVATIESGGKKLVDHYRTKEGFYDSSLSKKECSLLRILPENYVIWAADKNKAMAKEMGALTEKEAQELLKTTYNNIIKVLKEYVELRGDYYNIVALWIIGTYFHENFQTFPYIFFNAMRGSGKTRILRLVTCLAHKGTLMTSPTEAVLFRTSGTLGIDEFEDIGDTNKNNLRELLNASYKKGNVVHRMKKKKGEDGEEMVVEEFEIYRPIVMANIAGMEEVLGDRCISLILEKTSNPIITKLIEDFDEIEPTLNIIKSLCKCRLCRLCEPKRDYKESWNGYVRWKYTTHTTHTTYNTLHTLHTLYEKIHNSNIFGRNLELFLPLFWIADTIGDEVLDKTIETAKNMVQEKRSEEHIESKDAMLIDFISKYPEGLTEYPIKELVREFAIFADVTAGGSDDWLKPEWMGRALKRLNLIIEKKRVNSGIKVTLNTAKAKEKRKIFKEEDLEQ